MYEHKDYFETYLDYFPDVPSLVLVKSVELKNFPREFLKPPMLNLYCGDGFFSSNLGVRDISGCDISPRSVELTQQKNIYNDLRTCDIQKLPYENNSYNTILSNCALEHVEDINITPSQISRVLSKGSNFLMPVPNQLPLNAFPSIMPLKSIGIARLGQKVFKDIFSLEQWENLLSKAAHKIFHHYYYLDKKSYRIAILYDWLLTMCTLMSSTAFSGL